MSLEAAGALAFTAPQNDRFGPGVAESVSVYLPLSASILCGAKLRAGFLADGDAPKQVGVKDPGFGTLETGSLMLRVRPLVQADDVRRATGLFFEAGGGAAITGKATRAAFEGGVGYGIDAGSVTLGPVLRYQQVLQPSDALSDEDARLLMLGLELTLFDARPGPALPAAVVVAAPPSDQDKDGVPDDADECDHAPEDLDGFKDEDGCPEFDNDEDRIVDDHDTCPDIAEDFDGFKDEDGCPDYDNDEDTFVDTVDQCPNEAEIINGVNDKDGCPDAGLLEMKNNRIVLEESVLFEFERARVRSDALPLLKAIVTLKSQNPEWTKLRIEGHADVQGDPIFNQELSERRANNVMKALVELGIPAGQIEAMGFGSTLPRDKRTDTEGNARNRRVEFVVVARSKPVPVPEVPKPSDEKSPQEKKP